MFRYHEIAEYVVCGALARMQGRRLSDAEQRRLVLLSVMAPLYDDLFDERALISRTSAGSRNSLLQAKHGVWAKGSSAEHIYGCWKARRNRDEW